VLPVPPTNTPVLAKFGFDPQTMPMKPMGVEQCVAEALNALRENRSRIIPGRMNHECVGTGLRQTDDDGKAVGQSACEQALPETPDQEERIPRAVIERILIPMTSSAQAKSLQDEEELRRMIDAITQTIIVLNPDGKAIYANRVALDYTGLSLDEVSADNFQERVFHVRGPVWLESPPSAQASASRRALL
jgi:PAS domain-containing protein